MPPRKRKRPVASHEILASDEETNKATTRHVSFAIPRTRRRVKTRTSAVNSQPVTSPDAEMSNVPTTEPEDWVDVHAPGNPYEDFPLAENAAEIIQITEADLPRRGRRNKVVRRGRRWRKRRIDHLREFTRKRDRILDEVLRLEGLGSQDYPELCRTCQDKQGHFRCLDCIPSRLECAACICKHHACTPVHRIQRWNGEYFDCYSLREAGLIVQLGHDGDACPNPHPTITILTLIDLSGIHKVRIRYCDCEQLGTSEAYIQLLRARWWPATLTRPGTVATIRTLEVFHALTLQGKLNGYDFYLGLVNVTDATGLTELHDRYHEFNRMARCFRHIRMAKRAGRGHDPSGISGTPYGGLVLVCPACPLPGVNLPEGWEQAPAEFQFLYTLFLAMDANFKMKQKNHGYADIELAPGMAYFVPEPLYQKHLEQYKDQIEMKSCDSNFAAVDHANTPSQKRFAINGVGAVICARHSFFRTNGVGDLERGEKYATMDFILLMTLMVTVTNLLLLLISYDIACQYSKNFRRRMLEFSPDFHIDLDRTAIKFRVPKFHLPAHGASCQVPYSFNFTEGAGRTCGEGIEANWAETNGATLSTREMSHGARHEALNDVFGAINWCKTRTMGTQLARSLNDAVFMFAKQQLNLDDFKQTFSDEVIAQWEATIKAWEDDDSNPNPYEEPTSLVDVRLKLAEEEARELSGGSISAHETSATTFLVAGLELQEQQRVLLNHDGNSDSDTTRKKASLQEKRNALQHRIKLWRRIQVIYMPVVSMLLSPETDLTPVPRPVDSNSASSSRSPRPEKEILWMPSELTPRQRETGIAAGLASKELKLHEAEVEDALHNIRWLIRTRMGLRHYKKTQVNGPSQTRHTRARTIINRLTQKRDRQFERYRAARQALEALCPDENAPWRTRLPVLKKADLVDPAGHDDEDDDPSVARKRARALGEGRKEVPILWRALHHDTRDLPSVQAAEDDGEDVPPIEEVHESMRVTYARSRARVRRWKEETQTLQEEMRRVVTTLQSRGVVWRKRADARPDVRKDLRSGLRAYAIRQEHININMAASFKERWVPLITKYHLRVDWPQPLNATVTSSATIEDFPAVDTLFVDNMDGQSDHPAEHDKLSDGNSSSSSSGAENGENEEIESDFEAVDS